MRFLKKSMKKIYPAFAISLLFVLSFSEIYSQNSDTAKHLHNYTIYDLSKLTVVTGSSKKGDVSTVSGNVMIITRQMIEERGYQTLVDVCRDISSFDFMMYNDGGGEYPGFSKNRALGKVGNPEILIMIDGIVQNSISFNWSLLWTYDNMFADVEQIEIVQGPGSVMYGAQAFTGVINIITKKHYNGLYAASSYGSFDSWKNTFHFGTKISSSLHFSIAMQQFHSRGDMGIGRYDPGGYFSGNYYPDTILSDYDDNGKFIRNIPNPLSGTKIPDGFNTLKNGNVVRLNFSWKKTKFGFFYSDYQRGNASAYLDYEYNVTDKEFLSHYRSMNFFLQNDAKVGKNMILNSTLVYRTTDILPVTGFKYIYRFPHLSKSYNAYAWQTYLEERLLYTLNSKSWFYFGLKTAMSRKSNRIVTLGHYNYNKTGTSSSWEIAKNGGGLNQPMHYPEYFEKNISLYTLWDKEWLKHFSSSMGLRYDYSNEFGNIFNPRMNFVFSKSSALNLKLLVGTAFRQPAVFELFDEFRGNSDLKPEKITTGEVNLFSLLFKNKLSLRADVFHSFVHGYIDQIPDSTMPSLNRYANIDDFGISGFDIFLSVQITPGIRLYSNYGWITGINEEGKFFEADDIAQNKANAGINARFLKKKFIADLRFNYIGKRKAPLTNKWLQTYENGYAPDYLKANFLVTYHFSRNFSLQLAIDNLFNENYYGMGRESGNGFINDYDPLNNINPLGHIPPYNPQPGTTYLGTLIFKI